MSITISPSILSADFSKLAEEIRQCELGGADCIHVDVMDGRFVPNISFGPKIVKTCRALTKLPLDVHLMIVEPEKHLEAFAKAGADQISVHYETCPHIHRTLQTIRELGVSPGVAINPGTAVNCLREIIHMFELVSVNPGFGGQSFIPQSLDKIRCMRDLLDEAGSKAVIQVDGGIDAGIIADVYQAGARNFVAGTSIFLHPQGIPAGIQALRAATPSD